MVEGLRFAPPLIIFPPSFRLRGIEKGIDVLLRIAPIDFARKHGKPLLHHQKPEKEPAPVTVDAIREWFQEADAGEISDRQEVPPRVRVETRRSAKSVLFDTCDHGLGDAVLHRNLVMN